MLKKMMLLAMAVGALIVFTAPAVAQAELTDSEGNSIKEGSMVSSTSTNLRTTTAGGTLFCQHVVIYSEVTIKGFTVTLHTTEVIIKECSVEQNGVPVTITNATAGTITLNEGSGTAEATFEDDIPLAGLFGCHLSGIVGISYTPGTDVISLGGETPNLAGSPIDPAGCANAGLLEGSFAMTDEEGNPVTID
jgi:hypothetical protein